LAALHQANPATRVVLRGDESASYDIIMDVITRCTENGLRNIALASRQ
jgi:biopolymer transport protein ExbD